MLAAAKGQKPILIAGASPGKRVDEQNDLRSGISGRHHIRQGLREMALRAFLSSPSRREVACKANFTPLACFSVEFLGASKMRGLGVTVHDLKVTNVQRTSGCEVTSRMLRSITRMARRSSQVLLIRRFAISGAPGDSSNAWTIK
jgi:hypothetical protein